MGSVNILVDVVMVVRWTDVSCACKISVLYSVDFTLLLTEYSQYCVEVMIFSK